MLAVQHIDLDFVHANRSTANPLQFGSLAVRGRLGDDAAGGDLPLAVHKPAFGFCRETFVENFTTDRGTCDSPPTGSRSGQITFSTTGYTEYLPLYVLQLMFRIDPQ